MNTYFKLLLLLVILAFASIKIMLASDASAGKTFENNKQNSNYGNNYKLYKPEAGSYLGSQKLSTTTFAFSDNSCSMLY